MNADQHLFDVGIIGGGLAGLALSIQMAKKGHSVVLFEKEAYPFHKVCGEYISLESKQFLGSLGLDIDELLLPQITQLVVTSPRGAQLQQQLPLGGFGISRYKLDNMLAGIARAAGVDVRESTRVLEVIRENERFILHGDNFSVGCRVCCGSFGKRSNIDVKWKRRFVQQRPGALNNFVGVKYHAILDHPRDTIALHNFTDGYCGISPVEDGKTCVCYLTTANNLRRSNNNIGTMEQRILSRNPYLHATFANAQWVYEKPLAISQISFERKEQVYDGVMLLGDAAGMITPLCGNGMSMALHAARILSTPLHEFLVGMITRKQMETQYTGWWRSEFAVRLRAGRLIQSVFGRPSLTNAVVGTLKHFPRIVAAIIRQTHG